MFAAEENGDQKTATKNVFFFYHYKNYFFNFIFLFLLQNSLKFTIKKEKEKKNIYF
jgi:hypothetical protein